MILKYDMNIEERVRNWIETQHGTAGWEMKLVNLVRNMVEEATLDVIPKEISDSRCFCEIGEGCGCKVDDYNVCRSEALALRDKLLI